MAAALAVGGYLEASIREVFRNFGASSEKEREAKLLAYLKSQGKPVQKRTVYQMLNMSARELDNVCQPLAKTGLIKMTKTRNKMGRDVEFVEAL
jgi:hypothetical protein